MPQLGGIFSKGPLLCSNVLINNLVSKFNYKYSKPFLFLCFVLVEKGRHFQEKKSFHGKRWDKVERAKIAVFPSIFCAKPYDHLGSESVLSNKLNYVALIGHLRLSVKILYWWFSAWIFVKNLTRVGGAGVVLFWKTYSAFGLPRSQDLEMMSCLLCLLCLRNELEHWWDTLADQPVRFLDIQVKIKSGCILQP